VAEVTAGHGEGEGEGEREEGDAVESWWWWRDAAPGRSATAKGAGPPEEASPAVGWGAEERREEGRK
jgi:hypothetical protein